MAILILVLSLFVLIMVHECGHFIAAKMVGMKVEEFAFGFGTTIASRIKNGTKYAWNLLPIGGYVSILGESLEETGVVTHRPGSFGSASHWGQVFVLSAGVIMNLVLAYVLIAVTLLGTVRVAENDARFALPGKTSIVITEVAKDTPLYRAGIKPSDVLIRVSSNREMLIPRNSQEVVTFLGKHIEDDVSFVYMKNGNQSTTTVAAIFQKETERKMFGIGLVSVKEVAIPLSEVIADTNDMFVSYVKQIVIGTYQALAKIGSLNAHAMDSLSGPVGIGQMVMTAANSDIDSYLMLLAVISINLAIFNLLPIPLLDGGRIIIVCIEGITRRVLSRKFLSVIQVASVIVLILLMLVVTYHDIVRAASA